jgi:chaperonin GroES
VFAAAAHTLEGKPISGPLLPLSNFVLVKVREAKEQTLGGIILPDQAKEKPTAGSVVSVGPGKTHQDTNVVIPMPVSVGDGVLYGKYDGSKIDYNGEEHTLIRDEDILLSYKGGEMTLEGIEPAWDQVVVKVETSSETSSGIITASASEHASSEGQVMSVGKGRVASNGELIPLGISVGEYVKFRYYAGSEVRLSGSEYVIVRASDCLAKWA